MDYVNGFAGSGGTGGTGKAILWRGLKTVILRESFSRILLVLTPQHQNVSKPPIHVLFSGELQNLNVVGEKRPYREFETQKIDFVQVM